MTPFLQPTWRNLSVVLLTLWQIVSGGARIFVWGSVREGAIQVRPLGRVLRLLTLAGLFLVAVFLFSMLYGDLLRFSTPLEPLIVETGARSLSAPGLAIPLTLIALTLAWGYMLAGALHARPAVRWSVLVCYLLFGGINLISSVLNSNLSPALGNRGVATAIFLGIPILIVGCFIVLPRRKPSPALEFSLMLGLHGALILLVLQQYVIYQQSGGALRVSTLITSMITGTLALSIPFWFLAGAEMINFGLEVSRWVAGAVQRQALLWVSLLLLAALLGYRLFGLGSGLVVEAVDARQASAWGGAALLCAGLALTALWRRGQQDDTGLPPWLMPALAALVTLPTFVALAALMLGSTIFIFTILSPNQIVPLNRFLSSLVALNTLESQHRPLLIALLACLIAVFAARRSRFTVAAFSAVLAWSALLRWLTQFGRPLYELRYTYSDVDTILLLALAALTIFWAVRRELTGERALRLLGLAVLGGLLNQTGFLDNPFSPLFGFAGVIFLVFGIAWNVLTAGGCFANTGSPGFPQPCRLLLYLGYVLLSVSVAHWYLVSHNAESQALQNDMTMAGFEILGLPLAYLAFVEGGATLVRAEGAAGERAEAS